METPFEEIATKIINGVEKYKNDLFTFIVNNKCSSLDFVDLQNELSKLSNYVLNTLRAERQYFLTNNDTERVGKVKETMNKVLESLQTLTYSNLSKEYNEYLRNLILASDSDKLTITMLNEIESYKRKWDNWVNGLSKQADFAPTIVSEYNCISNTLCDLKNGNDTVAKRLKEVTMSLDSLVTRQLEDTMRITNNQQVKKDVPELTYSYAKKDKEATIATETKTTIGQILDKMTELKNLQGNDFTNGKQSNISRLIRLNNIFYSILRAFEEHGELISRSHSENHLITELRTLVQKIKKEIKFFDINALVTSFEFQQTVARVKPPSAELQHSIDIILQFWDTSEIDKHLEQILNLLDALSFTVKVFLCTKKTSDDNVLVDFTSNTVTINKGNTDKKIKVDNIVRSPCEIKLQLWNEMSLVVCTFDHGYETILSFLQQIDDVYKIRTIKVRDIYEVTLDMSNIFGTQYISKVIASSKSTQLNTSESNVISDLEQIQREIKNKRSQVLIESQPQSQLNTSFVIQSYEIGFGAEFDSTANIVYLTFVQFPCIEHANTLLDCKTIDDFVDIGTGGPPLIKRHLKMCISKASSSFSAMKTCSHFRNIFAQIVNLLNDKGEWDKSDLILQIFMSLKTKTNGRFMFVTHVESDLEYILSTLEQR